MVRGGRAVLTVWLFLAVQSVGKGKICFEGTNRAMTVTEADGQACINVTRSPDDPDTFGYRALTSHDQGAAEGLDFITVPDGARSTDRFPSYKTVSFQSSLTVEICVNVILDNIACETVEHFDVNLNSPMTNMISSVCHDVYQVMIEDSTYLPVRFAESEVTTTENAGNVPISIEINNGMTGGISNLNSADLMLYEDPNESGCLKPGYTKNIQFTCNHPTACGDIRSGMSMITIKAPLAPDDKVGDGQRQCSIVLKPQPGCNFNFTAGNRLRLVVMDDEDCAQKDCMNGGTQDSTTCNCVCPPKSTGEFCETIIPSGPIVCPAEQDTEWQIQWPTTAPDSTQSVRCLGEGDTPGLGLAHRRCLADAMWGPVDASECESVAVRAVRMKTEELVDSLEDSNGTMTDGERKMFQNISQDLSVTLKLPDGGGKPIPPKDLKTVAKFVEVVADLGENYDLFDEDTNETQQVVADILSDVLDERNRPAFATTTKKSTSTDPGVDKPPATSILQSTERLANVIASTLFKSKSLTLARPNLAINVKRSSFNSSGINFPGPNAILPTFRKPESIPRIKIPRPFLMAARRIEMPSANDTVEVVNVVMNNIESYLPSDVVEEDRAIEDEAEYTLPASSVISSQIPGYDGRELDTNETVEVTFPIHKKAQNLTVPTGRVKRFQCAFFNFTEEANQTAGWSYRGVETEVINSTHVHCKASHLTSFVVLVSIVPAAGDPPILDYITYVGCSVSLLCLLACIIFYLSLRKELIQKIHNFVHLNLCIALSLGLLLFLTGIQTATANIYACKVVTALLHYFFLATFTWTLCEAVLIYILLVKVFGANDKKWIYLFLALGWVLPLPIVVITGGVRHDNYLIRSSTDRTHPHNEVIKACWLPSEKGIIFAFIGPMVAIIVVNAVLLTISLVSLARSQCGLASKMKAKRNNKGQKYMKVGKHLLKSTVILLPLLGFTWIIGLFAVGEEGRVFAYLFVIANVFQGMFIFLLHVVRHEKVYGKIKSMLPRFTKQATLSTASGSLTGAHTSKSTLVESKKNSFFLANSENMIEFGGKKRDEDAESIMEGVVLEMKLNIIEVKDSYEEHS